MGCGDWNDGMNLVGADGRGESVWVGWFLLVILDEFAPLMERRGDEDRAQRWRQRADELRTALEQQAWDGQWYLRAYFDDGTPLGSQRNDECQIDSLAQSWAVLAGAEDERTDQALDAAFERLVFPADRLVALFQPPFDHTEMEPGYIKGYVPGVRENGGQYTHAVLWLIQALAQKRDAERAFALFDLISPVLHDATPEGTQRYRLEPYVVAADVYSNPAHRGRGGWSWYTGSASWAYRVALESLLGINIVDGHLTCDPCVPAGWRRFQVSIRRGKSVWHLTVELTSEATAQPASGSRAHFGNEPLELIDDGVDHQAVIRVGSATSPSNSASKRSAPEAVAHV
jgi:cyclic beta-1,2-glucan synthetase